jgi:hypothetical protein
MINLITLIGNKGDSNKKENISLKKRCLKKKNQKKTIYKYSTYLLIVKIQHTHW